MNLASLLTASADSLTTRAIGIAGLPDEVGGMIPGGLYGVRVPRADLRQRLILQTLLEHASEPAPAVVVSTAAGPLLEALGPARPETCGIRVFERPAHYHDALRDFGPDQFISEIEALELESGALLIIDGADELFSDLPASAWAQAEAYRQLMSDLDLIGVFLFEYPDTLSASSDSAGKARAALSGIATLNGELGRLSWDVEHWDTGWNAAWQRRFGVYLNPQRPWLLADRSELDMFAERLAGAYDEDQVFYTRASAAAGLGVPPGWVPLDDYADALTATQTAVGATVVLHYADHRELMALCRIVHALRYQCGRGLKILIRETGAHLRYPEELQVMRAGASAVVYRDARLARLLSAVETLRGHCYTGTIEADLSSTADALAPEEVHGYVPPRAFSGLIKRTLARTRSLDVPHSLVRLRLRPDQAHVDALTAMRLRRGNDLVTADDRHVYVFLFGCREPDVDATLQRLLAEPLTTLFAEQARWQHHDAIQAEIRALAQRAEEQPFVDFSLQLPAPTVAPTPSPAKPHRTAAARASESAPAPHPAAPDGVPGAPVAAQRGVERTVAPARLKLRRAHA